MNENASCPFHSKRELPRTNEKVCSVATHSTDPVSDAKDLSMSSAFEHKEGEIGPASLDAVHNGKMSNGDAGDDEVFEVLMDEDCQGASIITSSMVEEEERLELEAEYKETKEVAEVEKISVEDRLERLSLLLQKSQVYAESLLKVIENRKEAERKKAIKRAKILKKKAALKMLNAGNSKENEPPKTGKRSKSFESSEKNPKKRRKIDNMRDKNIEFLQHKLYIPREDEVVSQITDSYGLRYFGDKEVNASQPTLFTGGVLRDYQIRGFQWLKVLFTNAINGILADEMGLGKTIQCIALLCHIIKSGFKGPFLVCAPLSTIGNWVSEFKTFAPSLPVLLYHGSRDERRILADHFTDISEIHGCHPVTITTYEILLRDRPVLSRYNWDYLILDEGHRIKNSKCKLLIELRQLRVGAKLLLTGTPLQNNLQELWSLLNFLIPEVFDDLRVFESWFDFTNVENSGRSGLSLEQEQRFLTTLYEILTPFLLRRVKEDVELELPPKSEVMVYAPFSKKQEEFYQAAIDHTIRKLVGDKTEKNEHNSLTLSTLGNGERITRGTAEKLGLKTTPRRRDSGPIDVDIHISLNNIIMMLRKCCNHPYLIEYPLIPGTDYFKVDEELVSNSGKLMIMDQILPKLKERGHKVLVFSQMTKMMDILEDYFHFRKYSCVRLDGSTSMENRQENIKKFNNDSDVFIFLLSTRAGGLGINLTGADTVIIYDSDWNPQNDLQAQDRCHRIGQTRPVMVYRLVTAGSIDQKMVEKAAAKRKLEKIVIHKNKFKGDLDVELKNKMKIGKSEILNMLRTTDYPTAIDSKKALSEEEVEKILDRGALMRTAVPS